MATLSIDNKTEDMPAVIRGTWRKGGRTYALVLQPTTGTVILASFKAGDATAKLAMTSDGSMPRYTALRPMDAKKALATVREHSERKSGKGAAQLRGRWTGTVSHGTDGHPVVELTRRVGQGRAIVRYPGAVPETWETQFQVDKTWKGGPRTGPGTSIRRKHHAGGNLLAVAFASAKEKVRRALQDLVGESDRRQHHDAGYASKRPLKWSRTPKNPVDRIQLDGKPKRSAKKTAASRKAVSETRKPSSSSTVSTTKKPSTTKTSSTPKTSSRRERASKGLSYVYEQGDLCDHALVMRDGTPGSHDFPWMTVRRVSGGTFDVLETVYDASGSNRSQLKGLSKADVIKRIRRMRSVLQDRNGVAAVFVPTKKYRKTQSLFDEGLLLSALASTAKRTPPTRAPVTPTANGAASLSQADKDEQLMFLVGKAIKDALRADGSR